MKEVTLSIFFYVKTRGRKNISLIWTSRETNREAFYEIVKLCITVAINVTNLSGKKSHFFFNSLHLNRAATLRKCTSCYMRNFLFIMYIIYIKKQDSYCVWNLLRWELRHVNSSLRGFTERFVERIVGGSCEQSAQQLYAHACES